VNGMHTGLFDGSSVVLLAPMVSNVNTVDSLPSLTRAFPMSRMTERSSVSRVQLRYMSVNARGEVKKTY